MAHNRTCCFFTFKYVIFIYLLLVFIVELAALILFFTNFEQVSAEIQKTSNTDNVSTKLSESDKTTLKIFIGTVFAITLIVTLIQLIGVYLESLCIVVTMAIVMLATIGLSAYNLIRNGSGDKYSIAGLNGAISWFILCSVYACCIRSANKTDEVVPFTP